MFWRIGPGPMFVYECTKMARRWQMYALRGVVVLALFLALLTLNGETTGPMTDARVGVSATFYSILVGLMLTLVLLLAPVLSAGAICVEKRRGTLIDLLTTSLSDTEIIFGKLAGRLVPLLGLLACSLPVMLLVTLLGGVDPPSLLGAYAVMIGVAVLSCSLTLLLSVLGKHTHEVLVVAYVPWIVGVVAGPFTMWLGGAPSYLDALSPYWVAFGPYLAPRTIVVPGAPYIYLTACLILAGVAMVLAIRWLRPMTMQALRSKRSLARPTPERASRHGRRWPFQPDVETQPVLWREWHRNQRGSWGSLIWGLFGVAAIAANVGLACLSAVLVDRRAMATHFAILNGAQVTLGLVFVAVRAVTILSEERSRGSLDELLATPLSAASIVWGKWLAAFSGTVPVALLAGFTAFLAAFDAYDLGQVNTVAAAAATVPVAFFLMKKLSDKLWFRSVALLAFLGTIGLTATFGFTSAEWERHRTANLVAGTVLLIGAPAMFVLRLFLARLPVVVVLLVSTAFFLIALREAGALLLGVVVSVLTQGVLVTSLGLFLATEFRKPPRALVLAIAVYALVTIFPLVHFGPELADEPITSVFDRLFLDSAPWGGAGLVTNWLGHAQRDKPNMGLFEFLIGGPIARLIVSDGLFLATLLLFDRRQGRMPPGNVESDSDLPDDDHSQRSAVMGSSRDAFQAG